MMLVDDVDTLSASGPDVALAAAFAGGNKLILPWHQDTDWPRLDLPAAHADSSGRIMGSDPRGLEDGHRTGFDLSSPHLGAEIGRRFFKTQLGRKHARPWKSDRRLPPVAIRNRQHGQPSPSTELALAAIERAKLSQDDTFELDTGSSFTNADDWNGDVDDETSELGKSQACRRAFVPASIDSATQIAL